MTAVELDIEERELANGVVLVAVRNPDVRTFAAGASFRVGQIEEGPDERGLAYLVGSALEEGTRKRGGTELAEAVEAIGGTLDTGSAGATVQCPAEEAGKAVRLLREVVTEPAFPGRDVRRVQHEIAAEIEADDEDPAAVARRRFRREVYRRHPFGHAEYADAATILAYRPADLRRFHRRWFAPADCIVALAGPLETGAMLDLAAKAFRPSRGKPAERSAPGAPTMPNKGIDVHVSMPREQVHVYLGHPGIRRDHPDYHALLVMDHVLGSGPGFTSRIAQRLRDEQGLCYSVHASITATAGLEPGVFSAYIGTSPEHRRRAIDGMLAEIREIRTKPVTAAELADVHDYLTGSFVFALERNANLVRYVVRARRMGLGYDYFERFESLVRAVTIDDVTRVAREHLDPERCVVVSAGAG